MPLTPAVRDFLVQLEELMDRVPAPDLDRDAVTVTSSDSRTLVVLPHRTPGIPDVELQVDDRTVVVTYGGEPVHLYGRDFALQFLEALLAGRIVIEVHHGLWRTTRSYLDGQARPFLTTRMPYPSLRPRTERRAVGFR